MSNAAACHEPLAVAAPLAELQEWCNLAYLAVCALQHQSTKSSGGMLAMKYSAIITLILVMCM
jgi:hypothetical protein